MFNQLVSAS